MGLAMGPRSKEFLTLLAIRFRRNFSERGVVGCGGVWAGVQTFSKHKQRIWQHVVRPDNMELLYLGAADQWRLLLVKP